MLSSRDGYCTLVVFDEILTMYHTQQHTLQLQSIAHHNYVPFSHNSSAAIVTPLSTPSTNTVPLPPSASPAVVPMKRPATSEPPTPAASVDESVTGSKAGASASASIGTEGLEPPKKKRRAVLTRVGDANS